MTKIIGGRNASRVGEGRDAVIEQIEATLFRKYTLADYFIVPDSEVGLAGLGIRYRLESPTADEWYELTVRWVAQDRFDISLSQHKAPATARTIFLTGATLSDLDESVYLCIRTVRRERALAPGTEPRKWN